MIAFLTPADALIGRKLIINLKTKCNMKRNNSSLMSDPPKKPGDYTF